MNCQTVTKAADDFVTVNWIPRADVMETENGFEVLFDLPGVGKQDLEVKVERDTLLVSGQRKPWNQRPAAQFSRALVLPDYVDQGAIQARMADGVLSLALPRKEASKPKQIEIQVN